MACSLAFTPETGLVVPFTAMLPDWLAPKGHACRAPRRPALSHSFREHRKTDYEARARTAPRNPVIACRRLMDPRVTGTCSFFVAGRAGHFAERISARAAALTQ